MVMYVVAGDGASPWHSVLTGETQNPWNALGVKSDNAVVLGEGSDPPRLRFESIEVYQGSTGITHMSLIP